ncbi:MAG: RNA 2',3'-cyclic phosphodiesterase [Acidobacteria bacterium]|nr:RNA 2',3'-cyclic phosphodiesterase [Acidobacteriota bacterium]
MRSFIAITIPQEAVNAIEELQLELRRVDPAISWTRAGNVHLTLKFLGEIHQNLVPSIIEACSSVANKIQPFRLELSHPGVFPNLRNPRVIWVGLKGNMEPLAILQTGIDEAMEKLGFECENAAFRPHLTIGRVKGNRNVREMLAISEMYLMPPISFEIKDFVLFKSELMQGGSKYTILSRFPFLED